MRFSSRRSPDRGGVPSGTRLPLRLGIAGAVALSAILLGGCVQSAPVKTPQAHATVKPLFASDADALAAATKAYAAYLKMSDTITSEGGANPQRIAPFVSTKQLPKELEGFSVFSTSGYVTKGDSAFDTVSLQSRDRLQSGGEEVTIYACSDATGVRVLDAQGVDIGAADRPNREPFELTFQTAKSGQLPLVLARSQTWDGTDFC
jgi:hypothetical protein